MSIAHLREGTNCHWGPPPPPEGIAHCAKVAAMIKSHFAQDKDVSLSPLRLQSKTKTSIATKVVNVSKASFTSTALPPVIKATAGHITEVTQVDLISFHGEREFDVSVQTSLPISVWSWGSNGAMADHFSARVARGGTLAPVARAHLARNATTGPLLRRVNTIEITRSWGKFQVPFGRPIALRSLSCCPPISPDALWGAFPRTFIARDVVSVVHSYIVDSVSYNVLVENAQGARHYRIKACQMGKAAVASREALATCLSQVLPHLIFPNGERS